MLESEPLSVATEVFAQTHHHGLPVVSESGELVGILTVQDIDRVQSEGQALRTIGEVCSRELLTAYPDETIGAALRRMSTRDIGRLPVVARDNRRKLLGRAAPDRSGARLRHRADTAHRAAAQRAASAARNLRGRAGD